MSRLWEKGEGGGVDGVVLRYTVGDDHRLDERLVRFDVIASCAHARMLVEAGHLTAEDGDRLIAALEDLAAAHARGDWSIALEEEDCHTALETRLTDRLGELGGRIHLGRSRNDQVLAALRLYLLRMVEELHGSANSVIVGLEMLASSQGTIPLPGYTHLQRAMPSTVADWAGAYRSELADDLEGLPGVPAAALENPLGSAAGYGVPVVEIDRERTRELLGFDTVHEPVTAVQLSRGKAEATVAFEIGLLMQDLGRLASDLCLFATSEFGFVKLPVELTTGSSIMPQKRNPDVFELVRGRAAQASSDLQAILAISAKMTSGYHRDLQLIKAPLFRSIDIAFQTVDVMAFAVSQVEFVRERTEAAMDPTLYATEQAYRLVAEEGLSFREAYRRIGRSFS